MRPVPRTRLDVGIAESCLRRWLKQEALDAGAERRGAAGCADAPAATPLPNRQHWTTRDQLANAVIARSRASATPAVGSPRCATSAPADYETDWHRQQLTPAA